jgi:hypothetical protein
VSTAAYAVGVSRRPCSGIASSLSDEPTEHELTQEELEEQDAEPLPDREAMSIIDPNLSPTPPVPADDGGFAGDEPPPDPTNV